MYICSDILREMKSGNNIIAITVFVIIGIPLFVLSLPLLLVLYLIQAFKKNNFEKKYAKFLIENNGLNVFCYNNRKNAKDYIEETILPELPAHIKIVYVNGKKVESEHNAHFISEALYRLKTYSRFPHLMKIRNGKLIDKSINNPFYNSLHLKHENTEFLAKINLFFDLNEN